MSRTSLPLPRRHPTGYEASHTTQGNQTTVTNTHTHADTPDVPKKPTNPTAPDRPTDEAPRQTTERVPRRPVIPEMGDAGRGTGAVLAAGVAVLALGLTLRRRSSV